MRDSIIVQQQPPCPGGLPLSIAPGREGPPVWYCGPSLIPFAFEVEGGGGGGGGGEAGSDRDGREKEKKTEREGEAIEGEVEDKGERARGEGERLGRLGKWRGRGGTTVLGKEFCLQRHTSFVTSNIPSCIFW